MSDYDYIPRLLCEKVDTRELTTENIVFNNVKSPISIEETNNTLVSKVTLVNAGGSGASVAVDCLPWKSRPAGSPISLIVSDRDYSGDLKFKCAEAGNGGNNSSVVKATLNYTGMRIGDDQLPTEKLDVLGTIKCDSLLFRKDNVRLIPMSFQVNVVSNAENIISLATIMADYGISSIGQFRGLQYWLTDSTTYEVNKSEYDDSVAMKWKIQLDSGVPKLYIQHRSPNVNTLVTVMSWWAL